MKKFIIYLLLILLATGCNFTEKKQSYIEISYETYEQKMENKEDFILFIGSTTCSHCQDFKPVLENVITDYDLKIYYIDLYKTTKEQGDKIWEDTFLEGTPTIVFISKGKIKLFPRIEGYMNEENLIKQLQSAGYIE